MKNVVQRTHAFLHEHGMHPDSLDMIAELKKFRANMEQGLIGRYSHNDCKMLPAYVTIDRHPAQGEKVLTLDAGGTNLRAALVSFSPKGPIIEKLDTRPIPGLGHPVSRTEFLHSIARFAAPLAAEASRLGFCFSYQAEITPDGDGKVICFSKEVNVLDGAGMVVCQELLNAFSSLGISAPSTYALVNDTVAALLGGYAMSNSPTDGALGLILGTGNNVCYLAKSEHIRRPLHGWTASTMVVNMESGAYSGFPQGTFDKQLDSASMSPGTYISEKMVGGVYQGEVLRLTLEGAGDLFSPLFHQRLSQAGQLTAAHLSALTSDPHAPGTLSDLCAVEEDRQALLVLVNCLMERAAKLIILSLAGPMEAEDMGKTSPALVVAEGSTFWKNTTLRQKIEAQAEQFLLGGLGRRCTFVRAESPNLVGAAMAALQQHD